MTNNSNKKTIGIYHKDCIDGTTAAAVLLKQFPDVVLFSLKRGYTKDDFAEILNHVPDDAEIVYIVDFSLENVDTEKLLKKVRKVVDIDHHISAKESLGMLARQHDNFEFIFDNNRSGASLAWEYFYGRENTPELILLVEDGDIGKFEFLEKTKQSGGVLMPLMNKPEMVKKLFDEPIEDLLKRGRQVTDFMDFALKLYCERAKPIKLRVGKFLVIAYNATFNIERMRSTLGHTLATQHDAAVALFRISGDEVTFSFRGIDSAEPSALDLAKALGGGGHRNAAGAHVALKDFYKMIVFN